MSPRVRTICFRVTPFVLVFATAVGIAQNSIDQPHVSSPQTVDVATVAYSAPYGSQGLIRTSTDLVLVPVTITDDRNRAIVGLAQENFQLFENKKPQAIKSFSSEDAPVSIGILVDTSRSMSYKLERAREAVAQFCEAANPQDEFFVVTFSDAPQLATDFTNDAGKIANGLLTAHPAGRTALLDAIYLGVQKMRSARYPRRALLIISDGGDNHSRYTERDVKSAIRESDVAIYAIGTYDRWVSTQEELRGPELLKTIAELTGGRAFLLANAGEMPAVTQNIGVRLRHEYVLAYQPQLPSHDGKWHKISVKLRLPKNLPFLHVEARAGYYAGGD